MFIKRKCSNFLHKSAKLALKKVASKVIVDKETAQNTVNVEFNGSKKNSNKRKTTVDETV
jgi:hypothetical protein